MIVALALSSAGLALGVTVLVLVTLRGARRAPVLRGRRVTVHTAKPDDQTISGVLVGEYTDRLALVDAAYVTAQGETTIPGVVHVPTSSVSWMQDHGFVSTT